MAANPAGKLLRYIRDLAETEANKELTDEQLPALFARERQEAAFASLLKRHGSLVWSVCQHILGKEQDARFRWGKTSSVTPCSPRTNVLLPLRF
jgi:hypothetical protein